MLKSDDEILFDYMMGFVGIPYRIGGNVPVDGGIDCSGLALIYLQAAGKWAHGVDATAQGIYDTYRNGRDGKGPRELYGRVKHGAPQGPLFGDVAFYGASTKAIEHVALVLNANLMLEAGGGTTSTTTTAAAAERDAMVRIRPITFRRDFIGILRP